MFLVVSIFVILLYATFFVPLHLNRLLITCSLYEENDSCVVRYGICVWLCQQ